MTDQQMLGREAKTQPHEASRPPLPPFSRETAIQKVRLAEDGWNSRDPEKVALAYTIDSLKHFHPMCSNLSFQSVHRLLWSEPASYAR